MLIDLVPDFFTIIQSVAPFAAYQRYFATYRQILERYWLNYVVDPDSPHFADVVHAMLHADRHDLRTMLQRVDVAALARDASAATARRVEGSEGINGGSKGSDPR